MLLITELRKPEENCRSKTFYAQNRKLTLFCTKKHKKTRSVSCILEKLPYSNHGLFIYFLLSLWAHVINDRSCKYHPFLLFCILWGAVNVLLFIRYCYAPFLQLCGVTKIYCFPPKQTALTCLRFVAYWCFCDDVLCIDWWRIKDNASWTENRRSNTD